MNSKEILQKAASTYNERGKQYGDIEFMFDLTANLATMMTGREFTKYDVSVILEALKIARRRVNPMEAEHYIDQVNYTTFSAQFAQAGVPVVPSGRSEPVNIEADITEFAKKFAPIKKDEEGA